MIKETRVLKQTLSFTLVLLVLVVCGFTAGHNLTAQAPAGVAVAATSGAPAQDELVTAWLQTLAAQARLAQSAIDALPEVRQYRANQAATLKKVETRVPGYTIDFTKFALVPKTPPK
jgi:hypothetical protein